MGRGVGQEDYIWWVDPTHIEELVDEAFDSIGILHDPAPDQEDMRDISLQVRVRVRVCPNSNMPYKCSR